MLPRIQSASNPSDPGDLGAWWSLPLIWDHMPNHKWGSQYKLMCWTRNESPLALVNLNLALWWSPRWNGTGFIFFPPNHVALGHTSFKLLPWASLGLGIRRGKPILGKKTPSHFFSTFCDVIMGSSAHIPPGRLCFFLSYSVPTRTS